MTTKALPNADEVVARYIARAEEMSEGGKYEWWSGLAGVLRSLVAERDEWKRRENQAAQSASHWKLECFAAERQLAEAREALKPFANAAYAYEPDDGDDQTAAWNSVFDIGDLRFARAALATGGKDGE